MHHSTSGSVAPLFLFPAPTHCCHCACRNRKSLVRDFDRFKTGKRPPWSVAIRVADFEIARITPAYPWRTDVFIGGHRVKDHRAVRVSMLPKKPPGLCGLRWISSYRRPWPQPKLLSTSSRVAVHCKSGDVTSEEFCTTGLQPQSVIETVRGSAIDMDFHVGLIEDHPVLSSVATISLAKVASLWQRRGQLWTRLPCVSNVRKLAMISTHRRTAVGRLRWFVSSVELWLTCSQGITTVILWG